MQTFVMLTRLAPDAVKSPRALEDLERKAVEAVKAKCPKVKWKDSRDGALRRHRHPRGPDLANAAQVSAQVRAFGHAHTEIWGAMEWGRFKEAVRALA